MSHLWSIFPNQSESLLQTRCQICRNWRWNCGWLIGVVVDMLESFLVERVCAFAERGFYSKGWEAVRVEE